MKNLENKVLNGDGVAAELQDHTHPAMAMFHDLCSSDRVYALLGKAHEQKLPTNTVGDATLAYLTLT